MKLPIGPIARFAGRIVVRALAKAIASPGNPLTKEKAEAALREAVQDEVTRRVAKRVG